MGSGIKPEAVFERQPLGQILAAMGLLTAEDADAAVKRAEIKRQRLAELLLEEGRISDVDLARAFAMQNEVPFRELNDFEPETETAALLPEKVVRRFLILPVEFRDGRLLLAVYNPIDAEMLDLVSRILKKPVSLVICPRHQLIDAIDRSYRRSSSVEQIVEHLRQREADKSIESKPAADTHAVQRPQASPSISIEALVNKFLEKGMAKQASDIHIDPAENGCRVRMRLDGVLHEVHEYPLDLHAQIISRLKVLSGLDISERRNAQDGRFQFHAGGHGIDIRISTLPTIRGEKAVLRLLNKRRKNLSLSEIGMSESVAEHVSWLVHRPYGIVFVTGPTGSGKTTTMYSMLSLINGVERNIITVEDPVELTFDIIHQVQINEKAGVTYPSILRNILRQDPDVLMIGEVRDSETAEIAIRSALTGHLVLSTLHTNDAVSSISRLVDMKVEPFLLSSSLIGVLAQRLVRKLCVACRKPAVISAKDRAAFGLDAVPENAAVKTPVGCEECHHSGYKGRLPIFEVMKVDAFVRKAIASGLSDVEIMAHLRKNGFRSLREDGLAKVLSGQTSVDEVLKVTS